MKSFLKFAFLLSLLTIAHAAEPEATRSRQPDEAVNDASVRERPGLQPGTNLLFNGWGITPAGEQVPISDLALKLVIAPDGKSLLAVHGGFGKHGVSVVDIATRSETQFLPLKETWNGLAFSHDGKEFFVCGGDSGQLHVFKYKDGQASFERSVKLASPSDQVFLAGCAVDPRTGKIYICNEGNGEIWVLKPRSFKILAKIPAGPFPHTCIFGFDHRFLYVSDWGGRTVSVVDTKTGKHIRDIAVGHRPNDMALAPDGRLFVACSGDNTVHVIQTRALEQSEEAAGPTRRPPEGAREIISTSLYPTSPEGSTPDAVAVSPDGRTLFVANADNNCVMVANISDSLSDSARHNKESISVVDGFIPVGWYPTALAVSPDNQTLFVANGKGLDSRPNVPPTTPKPHHSGSVLHDYTGNMLSGFVSFISRPDAAQMAAYTEQVRRNSPYVPEEFHHASIKSDSVIPEKVGDPCPIKYVLYVIKENRTYDQILGDLHDAQGKPLGNGDPNLTLWGEPVTPNQHELVRDYVLLDNLYCNGEVSVDGHSWCDAAIATDFNQRSWILSYSKHGTLPGNLEMETPTSGYLWDLCERHGVSFKNYGEGARSVPSANRGHWDTSVNGRDMDKVSSWIADLHKAEERGNLPHFMIMSLGENHTKGTTPGYFTPDASVASNDLGLGRLIDAASRSRFWKEMAIFVIEDDAQDGPDHVDAHRTVGLVISPYTRRGIVDSTLYTTASMVRTIELILGLPPLTQYDAGATPMFKCFGTTADTTSYAALTPSVDMYAKNTRRSPGAQESARMNFRGYDMAPEDALNRVLWRAEKGPDVPYPAPIHRALFADSASAADE